MKGHNYGECSKCNKIHKHPKGMKGKRQSEEFREKQRKRLSGNKINLGRKSSFKNKKYEEIYGVEKSMILKNNQSMWLRGRWVIVKKDLQKYKEICSNQSKGLKKVIDNNPQLKKLKISYLKPYLFKKGSDNPQFEKYGVLNPFFGEHHTKECKQFLSEVGKTWILEKNPNWRGGISFEFYGVEFNTELRIKIRERDNHTCQLCKNYGKVIHHIDYNKKNNAEENLVTLCSICHPKTNGDREFWNNYFKKLIEERCQILCAV